MTQGTAKVLLIDDEPALLKMMGVYLTRRGFTVLISDSAEKGWELFSTAPSEISVAVIDATIGGIGMEEVAERMLAANSTMRIITASGYPVNVEALEAAAPGRVMFLQKPFSPEMLASTVRRMLAGKEEDV